MEFYSDVTAAYPEDHADCEKLKISIIEYLCKAYNLVYYQAKEAAISQGLHWNITVHDFLHLAASRKFVPLKNLPRPNYKIDASLFENFFPDNEKKLWDLIQPYLDQIPRSLCSFPFVLKEDLVGSRVFVFLRVEGRPGGIQGGVISLRVMKRRSAAAACVRVLEGDFTNEKDKWTEDDKKKISLNCKAKSILCCAISKKEFNRISACKSTMEMWEKLRITYEGIDKVKETRIDILVT
ncbi:hypothetical protein Taro_039012 [Colocasia esculenta]|uniref:Uncharacterized protein n=1 Tax=Colocasia esculenta TaxID=4460 RepID=A0A843W552_COLES|nr:hypothetical protein [Colocasia esculenta]